MEMNKKRILYRNILLAGAAINIFSPLGAVAATNQELEAKINKLESMLMELKGELNKQGATVAETKEVAEKAEKNSLEMRVGDTKVTLGGYIKADFTASKYSRGELGPQNLGRDFYIPGLIPVGSGPGESGFDSDLGAKETRFNIKTNTNVNGHDLTTFIEMDFLTGPGGNERVTNSYNPRVRHAFVKYDNFLAGQTWSTFQDVGALAENLDFIGPAEGTTFVRQTQFRYTSGGLQISIENPETTVTPYGGGGRIVTDDGALPDFVVRYNSKADWGHIGVAGIMRSLKFNNGVINDSTLGWGVSLSGKLKVGAKDDFRFMATGGKGLGRYLAINTANGAVVNADGELEAIGSYAGFVSYRHFWNTEFRSNLTLSAFKADNDVALTGTGVTKDVYSVHANLLYSPIPKITFGGEYMYAKRSIESGLDGDMHRLQFSAKYAF
ncbi:DcaP family trimeric outer membrane transporter [Paremcibacter congregatus]|uniref:Porin n=1 Tax=Paremcibacter congregatus TaxID=2043170 RepID=A0A2G4YSG8_9PROT|nr:DcaP family trimeric outer membrane transporter [Paremcibacter congregatus]PHZ85207.1 porin [Paremcibacter congregatus]QDE27859.1 porin [Paremcibacter congregatus]